MKTYLASVVARELLAVAKELLGADFPTKEALEEYLDEHPSANPRNHHVVPSKGRQEGEREREKVYDTLHAGDASRFKH